MISLILLSLFVLSAARGIALAENEEEANPLGEGRIWVPRVAFPPSDPTSQAGYLPLWDRDFSMEYLKYTLYLSRAKALELTKKDSDFYLRAGGRIYLDFANYLDDKNDLGSDGLGLRTFQIDADGRFTEKWQYRLSIGGLANGGRFDGSGAYVDDLYLAYVGTKSAWVFGQQDEPFSLEQMTSSLAITFMERALPNALAPGKNIGVSFNTIQNQWSVSAGLFGPDLASAKDVGDQGLGFSGRFVFRPERSPSNKTYHLGASVSYRGIPGSDPIFYRYRPESGLTDIRYVNTGDVLEADRVMRLGLEAAFASGPFSAQAEYLTAYIDRNSGYDDLRFYGWYAYVSWFLTGESRKYFSDEAVFGYPETQSKWGALEFAVRYSMLNLSSGSIPGGQERNVTLGMNWYINKRFRLMAEYLWVFCDENADDGGTVVGRDRPRIFQMRLQMRF